MSAIVHDILDTVIERARAAGAVRATRRPYSIAITFPDLTTTDNLALAQAVSAVASALQVAVDRKWLTDETAAEWLYQFG